VTDAAFISIAKATAKPDRAEELERELRARVTPTRAQPGNIEFSLYRSLDDPAAIVAIERWASRVDWERHLRGPHVTSLMAVFEAVLSGPPDIQIYAPIPSESA
jgi:quinol monooxygenase YgiN